MTTKEKILEKALQLFNKKGVESVTTRHIASDLAMSQGNLHYHFSNKDEIILSLFDSFLIKTEEARSYRPDKSFRKLDVLTSMQINFKIMFHYRFLFKDNEVVWRRIPIIKKALIILFENKKKEIRALIDQYKNEEIFRKDVSEKQLDYLAEQFIFSISSWLIALEYLPTNKNKAEHFARFTFRLWLPYLTEKEMEEWEKVL